MGLEAAERGRKTPTGQEGAPERGHHVRALLRHSAGAQSTAPAEQFTRGRGRRGLKADYALGSGLSRFGARIRPAG
jgi:hypothetical protein